MKTLLIEQNPWKQWVAVDRAQKWLMEHFTHGAGVAQPEDLEQLKSIALLHGYMIEIEKP